MCNHLAGNTPATYGEADMQAKYTVHLFNLAGEVLGSMKLAASVRLLDLESLRALGAVRVAINRKLERAQ